MSECVPVVVIELLLQFVLKVGLHVMKWKVIYKCVCVCVVIELLLGFVLKVGTFTSPVLVLGVGPYFTLEH